jgi:hypothetical protein
MKSRFFLFFFLWLKIFRIRNTAFQLVIYFMLHPLQSLHFVHISRSADILLFRAEIIQLRKVSPVQTKTFLRPCKSDMAAGSILRHSCSFLGTLCSFFLLFYVQSIEWFTEDQAFLRLYDSTPRTPSPVIKLSLFLSLLCVAGRSLLTEGGRGRGTKS